MSKMPHQLTAKLRPGVIQTPVFSLSLLEVNFHRLHEELLAIVREVLNDEYGWGDHEWGEFWASYQGELTVRGLFLGKQATDALAKVSEAIPFQELSPLQIYVLFDQMACEVLDLADEIVQDQGIVSLGVVVRTKLWEMARVGQRHGYQQD
jgi:hypothetical protein